VFWQHIGIMSRRCMQSENRYSHLVKCVFSTIFRSLCLQSTRLESEVVFVYAMQKYGKKEGIVPLILNIGAGRELVDTFTPRPPHTLPIEQDTGWAPELVLMLWGRKNIFCICWKFKVLWMFNPQPSYCTGYSSQLRLGSIVNTRGI